MLGCRKFIPKCYTKLNEINTKKKAKSISTFDFTTLYIAVPHNLLIKILSEVINFAFKQKREVAIVFQKHQCTGHQKVVEGHTSQDKL